MRPHMPPGFWRGVNFKQDTIYLECSERIEPWARSIDGNSVRRLVFDVSVPLACVGMGSSALLR